MRQTDWETLLIDPGFTGFAGEADGCFGIERPIWFFSVVSDSLYDGELNLDQVSFGRCIGWDWMLVHLREWIGLIVNSSTSRSGSGCRLCPDLSGSPLADANNRIVSP